MLTLFTDWPDLAPTRAPIGIRPELTISEAVFLWYTDKMSNDIIASDKTASDKMSKDKTANDKMSNATKQLKTKCLMRQNV